jgi:hypothetical protein
MSRALAFALLIGIGCSIGYSFSLRPLTAATQETVPPATAVETESETIEQLKQINAQLQDIATMLHSGKARVTVVINPD